MRFLLIGKCTGLIKLEIPSFKWIYEVFIFMIKFTSFILHKKLPSVKKMNKVPIDIRIGPNMNF